MANTNPDGSVGPMGPVGPGGVTTNPPSSGVTGPPPIVFGVVLIGFVLVASASPSLQPYAIGLLVVIVVGMIYSAMNSGHPIQLPDASSF